MAMPVLCNYLKKEGLCDDKIVIVSPDAGGVHRAELFAKRLGSSLAIVFKRRPVPTSPRSPTSSVMSPERLRSSSTT